MTIRRNVWKRFRNPERQLLLQSTPKASSIRLSFFRTADDNVQREVIDKSLDGTAWHARYFISISEEGERDFFRETAQDFLILDSSITQALQILFSCKISWQYFL